MSLESGRSYPAKTGHQLRLIAFSLLGALVFLSIMIWPEWWTFGTSMGRLGRRLAPVLLLISLSLMIYSVTQVFRGPVRVDNVGIFNPFAKRIDRVVGWSQVADIRRRGKNLEVVKTSDRRSVFYLELMREPDIFVEDLMAIWRERQAGGE